MLTEDEQEKTHELTLHDKEMKEAGKLVVSSQFVVVPPDAAANANLNRNCLLRVTIESASFLKDHDTVGK